MAKYVACLDCDSDIEVPENTKVGDVLSCGECGLDHEVLKLNPVKVEILEEVDLDEDEEEEY